MPFECVGQVGLKEVIRHQRKTTPETEEADSGVLINHNNIVHLIIETFLEKDVWQEDKYNCGSKDASKTDKTKIKIIWTEGFVSTFLENTLNSHLVP